jgi:hypothetical protein
MVFREFKRRKKASQDPFLASASNVLGIKWPDAIADLRL